MCGLSGFHARHTPLKVGPAKHLKPVAESVHGLSTSFGFRFMWGLAHVGFSRLRERRNAARCRDARYFDLQCTGRNKTCSSPTLAFPQFPSIAELFFNAPHALSQAQ